MLLDLLSWTRLLTHFAMFLTQTGTVDYEPCVAVSLFSGHLPLDQDVLEERTRILNGVLEQHVTSSAAQRFVSALPSEEAPGVPRFNRQSLYQLRRNSRSSSSPNSSSLSINITPIARSSTKKIYIISQ